jgi:hypothetical protein
MNEITTTYSEQQSKYPIITKTIEIRFLGIKIIVITFWD